MTTIEKKKLAAALLMSAASVFTVGEGQAAENEDQCVQDLTDPDLKWDIYRAQRQSYYDYVPFRLEEVFNEQTQEVEVFAVPTGCFYTSKDEYYLTPQEADPENIDVSKNYDMTNPSRADRFNSLVNTLGNYQQLMIPGPPTGDSEQARLGRELWTPYCETQQPAYNGVTGESCPYKLAYNINGPLNIQ